MVIKELKIYDNEINFRLIYKYERLFLANTAISEYLANI